MTAGLRWRTMGLLVVLGLVGDGCAEKTREASTPTPGASVKVAEDIPTIPEAERVKVKGRVIGPDQKPLAGVRVLFNPAGAAGGLAAVANETGDYEGESPVGPVELRVTHRVVDASGKAKATILYYEEREVPASGATIDIQTKRGIPKE